jgi:hypothetical protein
VKPSLTMRLLRGIWEVRQAIANIFRSLPFYPDLVKVSQLITSPLTSLCHWTLRTMPFLRRLEWLLEIETLTKRNPVVLAISLAFVFWRGFQTTQYGHIATDHMIYPVLAIISGFNPFFGLVSGAVFGIADFAQKILWNDIYGADSRFSIDYIGAMAGYIVAYSSTMVMGVAPGMMARVFSLGTRKTLQAVIGRSVAARADGGKPPKGPGSLFGGKWRRRTPAPQNLPRQASESSADMLEQQRQAEAQRQTEILRQSEIQRSQEVQRQTEVLRQEEIQRQVEEQRQSEVLRQTEGRASTEGQSQTEQERQWEQRSSREQPHGDVGRRTPNAPPPTTTPPRPGGRAPRQPSSTAPIAASGIPPAASPGPRGQAPPQFDFQHNQKLQAQVRDLEADPRGLLDDPNAWRNMDLTPQQRLLLAQMRGQGLLGPEAETQRRRVFHDADSTQASEPPADFGTVPPVDDAVVGIPSMMYPIPETLMGMLGAALTAWLHMRYGAVGLEALPFFARANPDRSCFNLEMTTHLVGQAGTGATGGAIGGVGPLVAPPPGGVSGGAPGRAGPPPILDPWTGKPLTVWTPGSFGPGENGEPGGPGMVRWGGNWMNPDDVREAIQASLAADANRAAESTKFANEGETKGAQWIKDRETKLQGEAQKERDQRDAQHTLDNIRDIANRQGMDDIWGRAVGDGMIKPDGTIDTDYVDRLRNTLRGRLGDPGRLAGGDDPYVSPFTDFVDHTFDDIRHSTAIRIGAGILSGGTSEIAFQASGAWDAMQNSFNAAANKGRPWDLTDALRSGWGNLAAENLPLNTIKALMDPNQRSVGNILLNLGLDAFTAMNTLDTARNIGASWNALQGGEGWRGALNARPPAPIPGVADDPARWPSEQPELPPRNVNKLPEGSSVGYGEMGLPPKNGFHAQQVADRNLVNIEVRPGNPDAIPRIIQGDVPKPMWLKNKSINQLDLQLGAPAEGVGRVGFFEPQMPNTAGMSDQQIADLTKRFNQRANEVKNLGTEMAELQANGHVRIDNGVVMDGMTGKPFTGDHDIFRITDSVTGKEIPAGSPLYNKVVSELQGPPFNAQHGAHTQWEYNPADPAHGAIYTKVDKDIRLDHTPTSDGGGGSALVSFGPGAPPSTSFHHGALTRGG